MVRVYNNQPYECYKETECTFETTDEALLFIYTHYYYLHKKHIQLFNDHYSGDVSIEAHMNEFTVDEAEAELKRLRDNNEEWRFFEDYDYEVL